MSHMFPSPDAGDQTTPEALTAAEKRLAQRGEAPGGFQCGNERAIYGIACDLRDELVRLRAELAKYVGKEPTIAEEMAYLSGEVDRLEALAADVTRFRVRREPRPGVAQVPLVVHLDPEGSSRWCVEDDLSDRGVRRVRTADGWAMAWRLSHAETYCWPSAEEAIATARRVLAEGGDR